MAVCAAACFVAGSPARPAPAVTTTGGGVTTGALFTTTGGGGITTGALFATTGGGVTTGALFTTTGGGWSTTGALFTTAGGGVTTGALFTTTGGGVATGGRVRDDRRRRYPALARPAVARGAGVLAAAALRRLDRHRASRAPAGQKRLRSTIHQLPPNPAAAPATTAARASHVFDDQPPARAQQVDRRRPVRRHRPGQPQLGAALAKFVGRLRQPRGVDPEQRIERLDFDVEPLHQRRRHAAQLREPAAHADLADVAPASRRSPRRTR